MLRKNKLVCLYLQGLGIYQNTLAYLATKIALRKKLTFKKWLKWNENFSFLSVMLRKNKLECLHGLGFRCLHEHASLFIHRGTDEDSK
jgi:hypothetical protein